MPASALEWALTLSLMPIYLWYGYTTGRRIGYWFMKKLFGGAMTCSHPYCWIYTDREPDKVPFYMLAHFEAEHPEVAGRLERPAAEALRR